MSKYSEKKITIQIYPRISKIKQIIIDYIIAQALSNFDHVEWVESNGINKLMLPRLGM